MTPEPVLLAEYVSIRRDSVDALLRLIDDRWTTAETVLKRVRETLWQAKRSADYAILVCENCGKTMAEHDELAQCYPALTDGRITGSTDES